MTARWQNLLKPLALGLGLVLALLWLSSGPSTKPLPARAAGS